MISGERVKQVRELRGLTQIELARSIGVHPSEIAQIETGRIAPGEDVLTKISFQLGFPPSFFRQAVSTEFPLGSLLLYRAKASITKKKRSEVYQYSRIFYEVVGNLEKNLTNEIPRRMQRIDDTPKNAAHRIRAAFGLQPTNPIDSLISAIEKNGVLVMALPTEANGIDAFSAWIDGDKKRPIIVLANNNAPGDRLRFSVAHELGHLAMHQLLDGNAPSIEKEANSFASEFLMPEEAMLNEIVPPVTLLNLMHLKTTWKVSIQALMLRAYHLEIITNRQYKYLIYQLNNRGWRKREPVDILPEKPRLIAQMAELLYGSPIDFKSLAAHVNMPVQFVKDAIEAHAVKIDNEGNDPEGGQGKRRLRLIRHTPGAS